MTEKLKLEPAISQEVITGQLPKHVTSMSWHLSPRYNQWILCFWQLSIGHNMGVYRQVKHRFQALTLAIKFDISHCLWYSLWCVQSGGRLINRISRMDRLPNFLGKGATKAPTGGGLLARGAPLWMLILCSCHRTTNVGLMVVVDFVIYKRQQQNVESTKINFIC